MEKESDVVISGMSGRFPASDNIYEFRDNLYNKVDMISSTMESRWKIEHPEVPKRGGLIRSLGKFDASFFAVHYKQAHTMDPMCRILLELAYEAIVDAGVNPVTLRGTKTGCFVGACYSESEKIWLYERLQSHGFGITGCSRAMLANRVSYWLDIHGPSYSVDSACSSSLYALDHAVRAIRTGQCNAALVGGVNLTLHPYVTLQFSRLGVLSKDGSCKCFDDDADGYCRSEGLVMIFLQKAEEAKRIYATVVHTKTNQDGFKEQGITFPSGRMQCELLQECYKECGISPNDVKFLEAHGTGTKVGDLAELSTIEKVFCQDRKEPLLIGSIKSTIGHSEPASAISAVVKVVLAMETGFISPNLHFKKPRSGIPALADGRMKVVTEVTPWEGGHAVVNSFGFGGANAHAVLRSNHRSKAEKDNALQDGLPRIVVISGRTEEAVQTILHELETKPVNSNYVALLLNVHAHQAIPGHIYRGYTVLHAQSEQKSIQDIQHFPGAKRPVWFVFAGMGSQWAGMGRDLLQLPTFARAIERCDAVLSPRGLDIRQIITDADPKLFDNILNAFVGIAAVQVGLIDVLTEAGVVPDGIVGHSVGELGCAYADGCFTAEQMVLSAYSRGLASLQTPLINGAMAAVGMSYEELTPLCPEDIEVACHNGTDSSTISGPAESVKQFVTEMKSNGIFAREVACSNIAYHSRYIAKAGPKLLEYLKEVISEPVKRSKRWISSSVPESQWNEIDAQYSSPEYHTNNLLRPVLFAESLKYVPRDAITIEIAPHGLLQAILRRSLPPECTNIALTQRGASNALDILYSAFGKMFVAGMQPDVTKLHPPVLFPVPRGTPMISPLVRWQHNDDWHVASFASEERMETGERTVSISVLEEENEFYKGHVIDGRNLFPATGYLVLVWESLAMMNTKIYQDMPVVFENVKFLRASNLPKEGFLDLTIMVTKGTGTFEVVEGGAAVVTGRVYVPEDIEKEIIQLPGSIAAPEDNATSPELCTVDVYKELRLRGYNYSGIFKGISKLNVAGTRGSICWKENWVAFMDCLMQSQIMTVDSRNLYVPTSIRKLVINPQRHATVLAEHSEKQVPLTLHHYHETLTAGGVQICGLRANVIGRRKNMSEPVLECHVPLTYHTTVPLPFTSALRALVHLVLENLSPGKLNIYEWVSPIEGDTSRMLGSHLPGIFSNLPLIKADINVVGASSALADLIAKGPPELKVSERSKLGAEIDAQLLLCGDGGTLTAMKQAAFELAESLCEGGFMLVRSEYHSHAALQEMLSEFGLSATSVLHVTEPSQRDDETSSSDEDEVFEEFVLLLARKVKDFTAPCVVVHVDEETNHVPEFRWLPELQRALISEPPASRIYVVSQHASRSGLLGLVNCLKSESREIVRAVLILDEGAPEFSLVDPFYTQQLRNDLLVNVLLPGGCGWASYRHLPVAAVPAKVTHAYVDQATRGDLSSFQWLQGPIRSAENTVHGDKHICQIYYSALNFKDVMTATGKLTTDVFFSHRCLESNLGLEFSGREPSGKRVMGMVISGALANVVLADPLLMWEVPANWTLEEAATVPVVYCTAYYALVMRGRMRTGESVLIHSGTGGVGQAAINIALHMGCTIFVTVGTAEKRAFLHKTFPQIPDANIGNSRDISFEQMIMERTQGRGVDLVLNSLAGEKLQASVRCLRIHGRFLEIGKVDMAADSPLGMFSLLKDIGIHGILLDSIIVMGSEQDKRRLHEMLSHGIRSGAVKPLVRQVYGPHQVETAYRFMGSGKHIGKVLIRIREEEKGLMTHPEPRQVGAMPRFYCDPAKSYVIVGGLGGFGLELADWLVLRGARKLVLNSRSGIRNGYQAYRIRVWESYGVSVAISRADVTSEQGCLTLLEGAARKLGPVDIIFNLAVVLRDALFENQNLENFIVTYMPKARATHLLDVVSRRLCTSLRQFVVFSSVSCGRGNAGQTNYGLANSVMERICEERRLQGFPAIAVQWGAVGDVGLVAEQMTKEKNETTRESFDPLEIGGTLQQSILSCLSTLDVFLTLPDSHVVLASMVVAEKQRATSSGNVVDTVVNILGIKDLKTVSLHSTLAELGMDSMMAVEIKQTLEREFEMFLSPQDIRSLTFARLQEKATDLSELSHLDIQTIQQNKQDDQWLIGGLQHLLSIVGSADVCRDATVTLPSSILYNATNRTIFMVPGVEGFAWVMEPLAKQLNTNVCCLQFPIVAFSQDIPSLAKTILQTLRSKQPEGPYLLVGYSFGTVPLLEAAWELQQEGHELHVWLVDGAPEALQAMTKRALNTEHSSEVQWQSSFLEKLLLYIGHTDAAEIGRELVRLPDWPSRLARTAALFPDETHREFHASCVDVVFRRFTALMNYEWPAMRRRLHCPVTLIRTEPGMGNAPHDYGLEKICEGPLTIHTVEATHSGILLSKTTADVINECTANASNSK